MVTLASALYVPLRQHNPLLLAAGFAPVEQETNLDAPELALLSDGPSDDADPARLGAVTVMRPCAR
jgi:hypothetical protein